MMGGIGTHTMTKIDRKDIDKLSSLARLEISEAEKDGFIKDLESILFYVSDIQKVATGDIPAEGRIGVVRNVMREDIDAYDKRTYTKDILANAPKKEGDFIRVKKILP
jgi:aspartyl-tRNA(Asn)/glutamyl-tRNA(Gln) amidotransferase subunit C